MSLPHSPIARQILGELQHLRLLQRNQARTMPGAYYTSPEFLELEKEELFRREWICLGHEGEIPRTGDYFTTDLVDEQLLVVRGVHAEITVLSNVCRHRGNVVARGSGNASRFTCGYHAWSYGITGKLIAAPLMDSFDKAGCSLPRFAVEIWRGFIFVNLDNRAAPLATALQDLEPTLRNYHPEDRHFLYGAEEIWATNWKCLVENFMEGYHLSPTHAKTLHAVTPTALCEKLPDGPAFTGYRARFDPSCPERGPYHPDLTPMERRSDVLYCIYPSFVVCFAPHFTLYMCVRPLAVDSVGIRWGIVGVPEDPQSSVVKDYVQLCEDFCAEDRATLEGLQKGLKSKHYGQGPLASDNFEGTIWDILRYMAMRLAGDSEPSTGSLGQSHCWNSPKITE